MRKRADKRPPRFGRSIPQRRPLQLLALAAAVSLYGSVVSPVAAAPAENHRVVEAARHRDLSALRALVKAGADVNSSQPDGATALHWAAHWDDLATAQLLLHAGARVNQANEYGATPLWLAADNGSVAMTTLLLDAGADPNTTLRFGETPLSTAARAGAVAVVRALLAHGAKIDAKGPHGQTALMWAAVEGRLDVMRVLVDAGASVMQPTEGGFTPLMFVARQGSVEGARLLLDHGADLHAVAGACSRFAMTCRPGATPLLISVVRGHVELAEFLLDRGADPNKSGTGYAALHWAAGTWETSTTSDYRFTEADWRPMGGIPSQDARLRLIKALVAHGADVNAKAVIEPPRTGYTNIVTMPARLRMGVTPFYIAAMSANTQVMRLLASLGADPLLPSADHTTPLMVAAGRLRVDADTRIREEDELAAVKVALEMGNDINAANDMGETVLHAAAMAGLDTIVEYLVQQGASPQAKTKAGKTPAALADGYEFAAQLVTRPKTAALLRKLGGE
jgi:ankyrin repeat protein